MDIHQFEPLWESWYIRKPIGSGSFGTVYLAQETDLVGYTDKCAVKHLSIPRDEAELESLKHELELYSDQNIDSFLYDKVQSVVEEYETLRQFNGHPNFVQVYNKLVRRKKDIPGYDVFIRMELLNSIDTRFKSGSINEQEVIRLGIDICTALAELQKRNLVHRDIKPQNILVSDDGIYKLSDFGSVRKTNGTATAMTMKGTFDYTAPEVLNGSLADSRVDIYSLGVVMYQLLNNHMLPPARLPGDKLEMKLRDISPALSGIVLKACEYDADKRWKSAEDMLDALRQISNIEKPHKATKQNWLIPFIASCAILAVSLGLLISGILNSKPTDEIISDLETKISDLNSQHSAELKTITDEKNALAAQVQELTDNAAKAADEAAANLETVTDEKNALAAQVQELTDNAAKAADEAAANLKTVTDEKDALAAQVQQLTDSAAKASDETAAALKAVTDEKNALAAQVQSLTIAADFANMNDKPENTIASGKWGTCNWWIDQAGTLVITEGTGSDTYESPWRGNADVIRTVMTAGTVNAPQSCRYLFSNLVNCISMNLSQFNTQSVTSMGNMFYHCTNLSFLNLSSFDTSNVTDMTAMFSHCTNLSSLDLSSFDTSNVTNMSNMFWDCTNLSSLDLSSFSTGKVTISESIFSGCRDLKTIVLGPNFVLKPNSSFLSGTWQSNQTGKTFDGKLLLTSHPQGTTATYIKIGNVPSLPSMTDDSPTHAPTPFLKIGDIVTFGRYEQDNNLQNGQERIEWLVLDNRDQKCLLFSRWGLEAKQYNDLFADETWKGSALRQWLNGDFLNAAFTVEEQSAILLTDLDDSINHGSGEQVSYSEKNTEDKIFLLSASEANQYFGVIYDYGSNTKSRVAPTPYALANGVLISRTGNIFDRTEDGNPSVFWWLRSSGNHSHVAGCVFNNGSLSGYISNSVTGVVRPGLWLDLDSVAEEQIRVLRPGETAYYPVNEILDNESDAKSKAASKPHDKLNISKARNYIANAYKTALGRPARNDEIDHWTTEMSGGKAENKLKEIIRNILFSAEFKNRNLSNEDLVNILYLVYLQREPDKNGMELWLNEIKKTTFEKASDGFSSSAEFKMILDTMSE